MTRKTKGADKNVGLGYRYKDVALCQRKKESFADGLRAVCCGCRI